MALDSPLPPPPEMCEICEIGEIDIAEAYKTWNMGIGLLVICTGTSAQTVAQEATRFGLQAATIGEVTAESSVSIRHYDGTTAQYPL